MNQESDKAKFDVVLFDLVGTLIYPRPSVGEVYHDLAALHGFAVDPEILRSEFSKQYKRVFSSCSNWESNDETEKRQWRELVSRIFDSSSDKFDALFTDLWGHFASPSHWRCYDDVEPCLLKLKEHNLAIGVASNFDSRVVQIVDELLHNISTEMLFWSTSLGYRKPATQFYSAIAAKLAPRSTVLMVGDDVKNDFEAPKEFGWDSILLDRGPNIRSESSIKTLDELVELLQS